MNVDRVNSYWSGQGESSVSLAWSPRRRPAAVIKYDSRRYEMVKMTLVGDSRSVFYPLDVVHWVYSLGSICPCVPYQGLSAKTSYPLSQKWMMPHQLCQSCTNIPNLSLTVSCVNSTPNCMPWIYFSIPALRISLLFFNIRICCLILSPSWA